LITDPENALAKLFDVYGEKKFMGRDLITTHRTTFVIDANWKIQAVIHPVVSSDHAAQILENIKH
jgi:peroxiredoxin Q/BCP